MAVMSNASTGFQEPGSGRQRGGHWNSGSQAGAAETTGSDGAIVGKLLQPGSRGTGGTEKGGSATMKFGNAEKRWTPRRTGHHRCETRGGCRRKVDSPSSGLLGCAGGRDGLATMRGRRKGRDGSRHRERHGRWRRQEHRACPGTSGGGLIEAWREVCCGWVGMTKRMLVAATGLLWILEMPESRFAAAGSWGY
ncbi:hypothetical protein MLD38_031146 [Melastoma candidum]|uniref:Uncharacterized protein n=1 Tax=Melastoma candidum TaxID=119954 RepID=A0ACB9MQY9_9MYRT|nr:hypothetical protein MLD38_031146 [Melastoma candidum]